MPIINEHSSALHEITKNIRLSYFNQNEFKGVKQVEQKTYVGLIYAVSQSLTMGGTNLSWWVEPQGRLAHKLSGETRDRINNMLFYNSDMRQDQPHNQQLFLHQISLLLKGYMSMLRTVEKISEKMLKDDDYTPLLKELNSVATQLQQTAISLDYTLPTTAVIESIFIRLMNRLREQITNVQKPSHSYYGSGLIDKLLKMIQECLKAAKTLRNIGCLFSNIISIYKQFTRAADQLYYGETITQNAFFAEKSEAKGQFSFMFKTQRMAACHQLPLKETHFQKAMAAVNGYFSSLSCLDLDFSAFKSLYYQTRSQPHEQLVQQTIGRNELSTKSLTQYNKQFQEYKRKKQRFASRKIRLISLQDIQPKPTPTLNYRLRYSMMSEPKKSQHHKTNISQQQSANKEPFQVQIKNPQQSMFKSSTKEPDIKVESKQKASYLIKNIYLTFRRPSKTQKGTYLNKRSQNQSFYTPNNLSKTVPQKRVEKKQMNFDQKHIRLSPVKFPQPSLKDYFLQQLSCEKGSMLGNGRPIGVIHHLYKQKQKQIQAARESIFSRKISQSFRFKDQAGNMRVLEKPALSLLNDITI